MVELIVNSATLASLYMLFSLGMWVTWGTLGILNFAHGAVVMFAALCAHLLIERYTLSMPVLLLVGLVVGTVSSALIQAAAYAPILARNRSTEAAEMQILIAGIGVAIIPIALAQKWTENQPFGLSRSSFEVQSFDLLGTAVSNLQVIVILAGLVLGGAVVLWFRRSSSGLALRGIAIDPETASLMGVNRQRMALGAMSVAGALAGVSGVLLAYYVGALTAESGDGLLLKAFAIIILGGLGSVVGVIIGSVVLASSEVAIVTYTDGAWVDAVSFGIILLMLLLRPTGLLGAREVRRS